MVAHGKANRIAAAVEKVADLLDPDLVVTVAVFAGETPEFAMARHRELRPDHAGRSVRFDWRKEERTAIHEACAVLGQREFNKLFAEIARKKSGRNFLGPDYEPLDLEAENLAAPDRQEGHQ